MLKLTAGLTAGTLLLVFIIVALGVVGGFAAEPFCGNASWYAYTGHRTANGELFDGSGLTAAMPSTRHIGETWRVTYRGKSVVVRVNDYGPAAYLHRVIDLSREAARRLGMVQAGTAPVCMDRLR